ncbi:MAG TPA: hypothetical protein VFR37_09400 [Longimicrobium sp.]|nr:hypothetical protein [Longimicrobium sp.]
MFTSASSETAPRSASSSAPSAETGLLMDAAWNRLPVSAATDPPACSTPYPRAHSMRPSLMTAMLAAGVFSARIRSAMDAPRTA